MTYVHGAFLAVDSSEISRDEHRTKDAFSSWRKKRVEDESHQARTGVPAALHLSSYEMVSIVTARNFHYFDS